MTTLHVPAQARPPAVRSASQVLSWARTMVDPPLRAAVDTLPEDIRLIAGYHLGWWEADGRLHDVGAGKAIRPALALLAAETTGGDPAAAIPAAVAVELVHNFSLLHDDVMDGDVTRRHRPTAWRVYGVNEAILVGDSLLTLAFEVLAMAGRPQAVRALASGVQELLEGQTADLAFERRAEVSVAECVRMAQGKTGALLGRSCALGALLGGAGEPEVTALRDFGGRLGLAFQHIDDLLGIWGDPTVTGKPVYSDLTSRKRSLPVVAALTSNTPSGTRLRALYDRDGPLDSDDLARAAEFIDLAGGRSWSRREADLLLASALAGLARADIRDSSGLRALAHLIIHRTH